VSFGSFKGKVQGFGQTTDKGGFGFIFSWSQAMIKVGNDKMDLQFIFQFVENVEKAHRVRASGDRDDDRIPFGNHLVTRDGVFDLSESVSGGVHEQRPNQEVF
jgi:hypothetical protein